MHYAQKIYIAEEVRGIGVRSDLAIPSGGILVEQSSVGSADFRSRQEVGSVDDAKK